MNEKRDEELEKRKKYLKRCVRNKYIYQAVDKV